jgi:hypothetical protein
MSLTGNPYLDRVIAIKDRLLAEVEDAEGAPMRVQDYSALVRTCWTGRVPMLLRAPGTVLRQKT